MVSRTDATPHDVTHYIPEVGAGRAGAKVVRPRECLDVDMGAALSWADRTGGGVMAEKTGGKGEGKGTVGDSTRSVSHYLSPGVYIEEVSSGAKPIEGVGTAVAAFVGLAESGPSVIWRRAGALLVLVTGAAAGVWAWRHQAGRA